MYLSVNNKIVKMNPLPIDVWESINASNNINDIISLHKSEWEFLEATLNLNEGYEIIYYKNNVSYNTFLDCIKKEEVEKIFNAYYFDDLSWQNDFKWEKNDFSKSIKNSFLILLFIFYIILWILSGFSVKTTWDKIFSFFEDYGVNYYWIVLLIYLIIIYSDWEYIKNFSKINNYDKFRISTFYILIPIIFFVLFIRLIA